MFTIDERLLKARSKGAWRIAETTWDNLILQLRCIDYPGVHITCQVTFEKPTCDPCFGDVVSGSQVFSPLKANETNQTKDCLSPVCSTSLHLLTIPKINKHGVVRSLATRRVAVDIPY